MSMAWPGPGGSAEQPIHLPEYAQGIRQSFNKRAGYLKPKETHGDKVFKTSVMPYQVLDEIKRKAERDKLKAKGDSLGPASYTLPKYASGNLFSFGSRFASSVRNTDHLRPRKIDGPGPGSYKLPSSVQIKSRHPASVHRTTFGTSLREFNDLPQDVPGPDRYRKEKFTEASHSFSFSQDFPKMKFKENFKLPGPGEYNTVKE